LDPNDILADKLFVDVVPLPAVFDLVDLGISYSLLVFMAVDPSATL
jgi:hypothetical protein